MAELPSATRRSLRPDAAEIHAQLLDLTAGLLARHGPSTMSMQMLADASGYSKAAMFRRFGDKERLVDEALRRCVDLGRQALATVEALPPGPERGRASLAAMLDLALENPGFIAVALASITVREHDELDGRLIALGDALLAMFDVPSPEAPRGLDDPAPLFRALGALGALAVLSLSYAGYADRDVARGLILETADAALRGGTR